MKIRASQEIFINHQNISYGQWHWFKSSSRESRCQFHQRFTCCFYARRSQKRQMILLTWLSFAHSGSMCIKAVRRTLMKLSPGGLSVSLLENNLGCRFYQPSHSNAKNASFNNKVGKLSAKNFYNPLAFPKSNTWK